MTQPRKGKRLGGTPSTLDDPTPPEAPTAAPVARAAPGQQLAPVPSAPVAAATGEPGDRGYIPHGPVHVVMPQAGRDGEPRPRAEDLVRPREETPREQISVMVPKALDLRRRMRRLWIEEELEVRDQVALALDAWLTEKGY